MLPSLYGFLAGARPFDVVELIRAGMALDRYAGAGAPVGESP